MKKFEGEKQREIGDWITYHERLRAERLMDERGSKKKGKWRFLEGFLNFRRVPGFSAD